MNYPTGEPLVLVIEHDMHSRRFIASALAAQGMRCMHAGTQAHLRSVLRHDHDLVLVDAGQPDAAYLDLIERLRARTVAPIVALLTQATDRGRTAVLEAGANDYVVHPFRMEEVVARIHVWLKHGSGVKPHRPRSLTPSHLRIDRERQCVFVEGLEVHVPPVQYKLLDLIARAGAAGASEGQLVRALWGSESSQAVQYLRNHVRQLRSKIEVDPAHPRHLVTEASRPGRAYRLSQAERT
jgi:two-component system KDP operon response regulator KdpE